MRLPSHVLVLVLIAACRRDATHSSGSAQPADATAATTLDAYCATYYAGKCPTYAEGIARLRKRLVPGAYCLRAEAGTCGSTRYIDYATGFESYTEMYDSEGRITAANVASDMDAKGVSYGASPPCVDRKATNEVACNDGGTPTTTKPPTLQDASATTNHAACERALSALARATDAARDPVGTTQVTPPAKPGDRWSAVYLRSHGSS